MANQKSIKSATSVMAVAQLVNVACRFVRNIVLARLLLPADFGVGATFALTLSLLEMVTELGPRKQLVQASEGGSAQWQATAQMFFVARGVVLSTVLFFLAPKIAGYIKLPEATVSFQWLAMVPLIRGLLHCDIFRFQRELKLGRMACYQAIPTILGVLTAPLFALTFKNYQAFLAVILTEATLATMLSHLLASRDYQWKFDIGILRRFVGFGWPLIGNGLLMFSVMHGDRFLIASYFSHEILGAFSVVFMLSLTPTMALANLHGSVVLPLLSRAKEQNDKEQLHNYCWRSAQVMCLLAGLMATLFITAGPWLVKLIYTDRYLLASAAIPWIGLMCAARLARTTTSMTAVAHGETKIPLISNIARAISFLVAWYLASKGAGLTTIPICGFLGELVAYSISVLLIGHRCGLRRRVFYGPLCMVAVFVACVWVMTHYDLPIPGTAPPWLASLWLLALIAYCATIWPSLRQMAFAMIRTN